MKINISFALAYRKFEMATEAGRSRRRGSTRDVWDFADNLVNSDAAVKKVHRLPDNPDEETIASYMGRMALIETGMRESTGTRITNKTFLCARVVNFNTESELFVLQAYNRSGDPDGKALEEGYDDVWVLPAAGTEVVVDDKASVVDWYCTTTQTVHLETPSTTTAESAKKPKAAKKSTPVKKKASKAKSKKTKKKKKPIDSPGTSAADKSIDLTDVTKKRKASKTEDAKKSKKSKVVKKKASKARSAKNKKKKKPLFHSKKKKKPLDLPTSSSGADEDHLGKRFNLRAVLESFENPRNPLFTESLEAEMRNHPELAEMTPENVERDPPKILFTSRRKGYFKCPNLCRVWLLEILRWLRARGETFVQWKDPTSGQSYDGLFVLAHAVTIKYSSMHKPGVTCHVYDTHIWTLIYGHSYMGTHIWALIYGHSYMGTHICGHISAVIYIVSV